MQNTLEDLEDSGCIKMSEDSVEPMMLGSIASQYYLSYLTVSMFGSNIGSDTSLEVRNGSWSFFIRYSKFSLFHFIILKRDFLLQVFLHILSAASEYDELPVRHNEVSFSFLPVHVYLVCLLDNYVVHTICYYGCYSLQQRKEDLKFFIGNQ